jgi:hypothetical protein
MNKASDIVREDLQQHFVDLGNSRLATHGIPEDALDGGESRFDVRPLVVSLQKRFPVQNEKAEQLIPGLGFRSTNSIALERDECSAPLLTVNSKLA